MSERKYKIRTAIILAGGKGTRLRNLNSNISASEPDIPKPMTNILGKPILEYTINGLKNYGVERVILGVAYKKEKIIEYFGNGGKIGVQIEYNEHSVEDGTGDAFKKAMENKAVEDCFYAMNSDQFTTFPYNKLSDKHFDLCSTVTPPPLATILLVHPISPYGIVETDKKSRVISFKEKPLLKNITVNAGIYVLDKKIKPLLKGDIEKTTFVTLTKQKKMRFLLYEGLWDTINTFKDLERVEELLLANETFRQYFGVKQQ